MERRRLDMAMLEQQPGARALRPSRFAEGELMHLSYGPGARA